MKVVLKQDLKGVGRKFDVKEVSQGYANNFLIPKKLAEFASLETIKKFESIRSANEAELAEKKKAFKKDMEMLKDAKIFLNKKTNEKGHLFEKISKEEIVEAVKNQTKISLDPDFLYIEKPIKESGEHKISISMGEDSGELNLFIKAS